LFSANSVFVLNNDTNVVPLHRVKRKHPTQVTGIITNGEHKAAVRPRVRTKGTDITAFTDKNGSYTQTVSPERDVLLFESDNYPTRKVLLDDYISVSLWHATKKE